MRILIAHARFLLGGSETYAVTVAEQFERLGHPVTLFAGEASPEGRALAESRGLTLVTGEPGELAGRDDFDAAIAQDAAGAYALAGRRELPQVFAMHGFASFEHPPQAQRPTPPVVVLNDRVAAHAAGLAAAPEIVRLRQPINLQRFRPRGPARPRARRVLLFSNYLEADRLAMLQGVCDDLGLELDTMGVGAKVSLTPQERIAAADIVVGYGRSVLEAMVMGRAAYVWDRAGGDGWVTPESYPALEADGFSGAATEAVVDAERMREDFTAYRPELGTLGYDLVRANHSAIRHTAALVELLGRTVPPAPDPAHEALGILVRSQVRAEDATNKAELQLRVKGEEMEALRTELGEARQTAERLGVELAAERRARLAAEEHLRNVFASAGWRATAPLRRLNAALRRLREWLRRAP
jgi:hypothetical protein